MHKNKCLVSVIIPAYNEAATISAVIDKIDRRYEIIVVDDGSTEDTSEIARKHHAKVISYRKNRGKGYAIRQGILKASGSIIVFLDGDGQHDPKDIPKITNPISAGKADLVIGMRTSAIQPHTPNLRWITNRLSSMAILAICGSHCYDVLSGFRAMRRDVFSQIQLSKSGFETELELTIKAYANNLRIYQTPITAGKASRESNFGMRAGMSLVKYLCSELVRSKLRGGR